MKLFPSQAIKNLIDNYDPLPPEELNPIIKRYVQKRTDRDAEIILNSISRIFAKEITRNEAKFIAALGPNITYDDLFNEMTIAIFKFIDRFDPKKSKFNTWVTNALWPLTKNPLKLMGDKFIAKNKGKMINIDKPIKGSEDVTIGDLIADGSPSVQKQLQDEIQDDKLKNALSKLTKEQQQIVKTLFGFIPIKKQWQKKLKDGTITVNAASIGRGMGYSGGKMRGIISKIMQKLREHLIQQSYDKYYAFDRLIQMYSGKRKFNHSYLLN